MIVHVATLMIGCTVTSMIFVVKTYCSAYRVGSREQGI